MRFAALETSSDWCSVALWLDGEIVSVERRAPNRHSELVLPMLHQLLKERCLKMENIEAIAFGAGPGAFTGLRIACGIGQGLALARGLPVAGVSSFDAMAEECGAARVVACIDARMHEVYYAALEREGAGWREAVPGRCVAPDAAEPPPGEGWVGCGSGFAAFPAFLQNKIAGMNPAIHPTAHAVAKLAAPQLLAGKGVDASQALPTYFRDKVAFTKAELAAR
ncbi:MAG: tRNA (adenosine(37)-N6)-threonylcarbamoyltransferase complex dimerization subunit type 1 TsaB [Clostridia bacterium]